MKLTYGINRITFFGGDSIMKLGKLKIKSKPNLCRMVLHLLHWKICPSTCRRLDSTNMKNDAKAVLKEKDHLLVIYVLSRLFLFYITSLFQSLFRRIQRFQRIYLFIFIYKLMIRFASQFWSELDNCLFFIFALCNKKYYILFYILFYCIKTEVKGVEITNL